MKCPNCGATMYTSMGGLEICPQCGYGSPSEMRKKEAQRAAQQTAQLARFFDGWKFPLDSLPDGTTLTVDNGVLVLGLDKLYRDAMKAFEGKKLLACAEKVVATLQVEPAQIPTEGYYTESPALTRYFRLMRALQEASAAGERKVKHLTEFQLLWEVTNSPLYGRPQRGGLFPISRDPLTQALIDTRPDWSVEKLTKSAYYAALRFDDISLVGLAARAQDAVVLTATRESVVLYAEVVSIGLPREPKLRYEWRVDEVLVEAVNRFIHIFNGFVPGALPLAEPANADKFYKGYTQNDIIGRCVRIGISDDGTYNYHWAIAVEQISGQGFELAIDEFCSAHLWTTEEYREFQKAPTSMKFFSKIGVPWEV